ncbi:MAG: GTP-binding protein [Deltaproteobacteria bacterium]|nr:GTP-binding protein [Deltaproteobacteria bacterium]
MQTKTTTEFTEESMNIVIVGHVDHGKSTVIGRLLADTGSLPEGKLEAVRRNCERNAKPFEYAFLLDALKQEQAQGITIDSSRVFFKSARRRYIIIDAPGHIEFLKNMITGAARAEAALLVIDAKEGIQENSRRHGFLLSLLGIRKIVVLVNKMDLVDYRQSVFESIREEFNLFLAPLNIHPADYIPVSGFHGDNIARQSPNLDWFKGSSVLSALDSFEKAPPKTEQPLRLPVQDVYKFTNYGDDRRIIAGTIASGRMRVGEKVIFYPSGKSTTIKSFEGFNVPQATSYQTGNPVGFTMQDQIFVQRGEIATQEGAPPPKVAQRIRVSLFWLGKEPFTPKKEYLFKLGTAKVKATLEKVIRHIDSSNLSSENESAEVGRHHVAECILKLGKAIAFDLSEDNEITSRFALVDEYEIRGGGIILEDLTDAQAWVRDSAIHRNIKWETSFISMETRMERNNQQSALVVISGPHGVDKKQVAKALEAHLFSSGKQVYYLGIGSIIHGVDADLGVKDPEHKDLEHIRRLAEIAHIMLDAGMILIITMTDISTEDLEIIKTVINPERIEVINIGKNTESHPDFDLIVPNDNPVESSVSLIKSMMQDHGILFRF